MTSFISGFLCVLHSHSNYILHENINYCDCFNENAHFICNFIKMRKGKNVTKHLKYFQIKYIIFYKWMEFYLFLRIHLFIHKGNTIIIMNDPFNFGNNGTPSRLYYLWILLSDIFIHFFVACDYYVTYYPHFVVCLSVFNQIFYKMESCLLYEVYTGIINIQLKFRKDSRNNMNALKSNIDKRWSLKSFYGFFYYSSISIIPDGFLLELKQILID